MQENKDRPVIDSSLMSPVAIASVTEMNPDSESWTVALTTLLVAPRSVKLPRASATPVNSTSRSWVGKPLECQIAFNPLNITIYK